GADVEGELRVLLVSLLQLKFNGRYECRLRTLRKSELVIIAVTAMFQLLQLIVVGRDQAAHVPFIAHHAGHLRLGRSKVGLRRRYIGLHTTDIGLHAGHIRLHSSYLLVRSVLRFSKLCRRCRSSMLRRDQLVRPFLQFFLRQSYTLAEHLALGLHAVVGLFQLVGERLIALVGCRYALLCGCQVVLQPERPAKGTQRQNQTSDCDTYKPAGRLWGCFYILTFRYTITHSYLLRAFRLRPAGP